MITSRVPIPADRVESALSVRRSGAPRRTHSCARGLKSTVSFGMFGVFATPATRLQLSPLRTRRERASCSSRIDASAKRRGSVAGPVDGVDAPPAFPRRAALAGVLSAAFIAPATPAIAGNPFSDFADAQLASKARLFMGPLQLTSDRLAELRAAESNLSVEDLAQTLGAATLDCMNPRGPLAAYANVRDVCTLKILLRSATEGPAVRNAPDSPLSSPPPILVPRAAGELRRARRRTRAEPRGRVTRCCVWGVYRAIARVRGRAPRVFST